MTDWQPIETAPKGGAHYLAFWPDTIGNGSATIVETWFNTSGGRYESAYDDEPPLSPGAPTHWMPLPPEPPK